MVLAGRAIVADTRNQALQSQTIAQAAGITMTSIGNAYQSKCSSDKEMSHARELDHLERVLGP
jgi:hypothetical protein